MNIDYDTLFCLVDDFSKAFDPWYRKQLISDRKIILKKIAYISEIMYERVRLF